MVILRHKFANICPYFALYNSSVIFLDVTLIDLLYEFKTIEALAKLAGVLLCYWLGGVYL